ncbi:hypothetical protein HIM_03777 [Hirsutella minnesotensis 3608]|uniref:Uncharacterized protein n=1 Tax=Hirsutella minnesotensis 3608 TaxID=1043627 RepID=A0A0F7ZQA3_9HYPO|nr:hypothetical protein HIM_03777 [Hirsutella minnesotensis 3608]
MTVSRGWHLFKNPSPAYLSLVVLPLSSLAIAFFIVRNWLFGPSVRHVPLPASKRKTLNEKDTFMQHTQSLGLPIPDTQVVKTESDIIEFLRRRGGLTLTAGASQYLLKLIGVNDLARFNMPLLPLATEDETLHRIGAVPLSGDSSFIPREGLCGIVGAADVLRGAASRVAPEPQDAGLHRSMAQAGGAAWTGHVGFDFLAKAEPDDKMAYQVRMYPIECSPRVHTAVVLFNDTPAMVDEYLAILDDAVPTRKPLVQLSPRR